MRKAERAELYDPKPARKKKRKKHGKSILQDKADWQRCYICMIRDKNYREHRYLEKHHVMFGQGRRDKAEADGLTVRLCPRHHNDVHNMAALRKWLCGIAQRAYEGDGHTRDEWRQRYGKSYLEE